MVKRTAVRRLRAMAVHGLMILQDRRVGRHIVVFESDDWGSVRMPSLKALSRMKKHDVYSVREKDYDSLDTLASNEDLELLAEALESVKGGDGRPAKMTLNTCVANPDFEKIKASDFREYYYEPFPETLKRYPHHDRVFELWKEGIDHKVFRPQFHGREHLNAQKWMRYLKAGNKEALIGFNEGCYSVKIRNNVGYDHVLQTFGIDKEDECEFVRKSIQEGLDIFEQLFEFRSESMIAPCYTWDDYIEEEAVSLGVRCFQGGYIQGHSPWQECKGNNFTGHYMGECNHQGWCYLVRNCSFEPSQISKDNADSCMAGIEKAFRRGLPAVVSCHRLNFIGDLNMENRDNNLQEFRKLLKMITEKYPDVEFMSSEELSKIYLERKS